MEALAEYCSVCNGLGAGKFLFILFKYYILMILGQSNLFVFDYY
jgi:hypothetical protein